MKNSLKGCPTYLIVYVVYVIFVLFLKSQAECGRFENTARNVERLFHYGSLFESSHGKIIVDKESAERHLFRVDANLRCCEWYIARDLATPLHEFNRTKVTFIQLLEYRKLMEDKIASGDFTNLSSMECVKDFVDRKLFGVFSHPSQVYNRPPVFFSWDMDSYLYHPGGGPDSWL